MTRRSTFNDTPDFKDAGPVRMWNGAEHVTGYLTLDEGHAVDHEYPIPRLTVPGMPDVGFWQFAEWEALDLTPHTFKEDHDLAQGGYIIMAILGASLLLSVMLVSAVS